ncbi:hypothetical protein PYW07_005804 [Mythimna separata]|uniref:Shavenoid isoform B-like N-terminal domain-containing protein n=1 Tax=Mythimna separata TaxID=271217 RepID=A0AAD7YJK7_MYTSE|nr:hypothetical protein PYW07_005804 [Mythimna separata]
MAAAGGSMAATLLLVLATAAAGARLGELARRDTGDIFTITGDECGAAQCAEHGAGARAPDASGECACACPQRAPLFREDRELCVDDLPECSLATFGTGSAVQRIPFVYLPLKGQIIHPSREITFQNVKTPICAVSGAQFLTRKGFLDLRNTLDADVPFNLFRDEGRTFLQWSGENDVRARMTGRVMVVRLLCRDVSATPTSPLDLRGVFTPCVAFRVQGTPPKPYSNVTEVQFAPNAQTSGSTTTSGLTVSEYVAIGISSLLLGLIYVASVFLFLHIRKRRKAMSDEDGNRRPKGLKKKDGSAITERDIVRVNNERIQTLPNAMGQDDGVIKKNPLLNINRQLHENKNFTSDSGSNISDSDDFGDSARSDDNLYNNQTTSAVIHQHYGDFKVNKNDNSEVTHRDESGFERLPDEHVSIVETQDDREIARPVGTTRRKLYFNPAYFEPHLMAEPPAAALEFLVKIREVIAIAKHKMAAKRFQPILNQIPEEETYPSNGNSIDMYTGMGSASPSLSSALPLEEELTMRNAVYKIHSSSNSNTPSPHREVCIDNHYETIEKNQPPPFETPKASLVSEVYVNNTYNFGSTPTSPSGSECSMGSRKLITTINDAELKPGCLTIEVKDSPENYIKIHESDGFEPDTLDRKHPKHKEATDTQFSRKDLIKNIDKENSPPIQQRIQLRSSGTFQKTSDKVEYAAKFNSLRHEYEQRKNGYERPKLTTGIYSGSKSLENTTDDTWQEAEEWTTEEGRILTLELRHSKRQRQSTPPTIKQLKNLARPDVLPPLPPTDEDPIYEQPIFPPRKVEADGEPINEIHSKNVIGRSLSPREFTKNITIDSHDSSITPDSRYGPSCSPMRASVQSQSSEYENMESVSGTVRKAGDISRNLMRKRSGRTSNVNTDTFVKGPKLDGHSKARFRRKKGFNIQDSGYLSSDSTSSRQVPRKLVIAKIVSCSESDDTENEARSESGAESIETHSVYFDSFRKMQTGVEDDLSFSSKSFSDVNGKFKHSDDCL